MERLKIKVQPLFMLYVFLCIYFGWYNDIFYYIVVLYLHEYGHYLMLRKLGYEAEQIIFSVYGSRLESHSHYQPKDEILIALAGPMINVIFIVCTVALWWVVPSIYLFTETFVFCNLVVLVFNLLPIYPLDGGRVVLAISSLKIKRKKLEKISSRVCLVLGVIVLILFIVSLFIKINYNLLFIGIFLTLNSTGYISQNYLIDGLINKKYNRPLEIKKYKVKGLEDRELIKYISPNYYSIFEVERGERIIIIEEKDLLDYGKNIVKRY